MNIVLKSNHLVVIPYYLSKRDEYILTIFHCFGSISLAHYFTWGIKFGPFQVEEAKSLLAGRNTGRATALAGVEGKMLNVTLKFCIVCVIVLEIIAYFAGPMLGL